MAYMCRRVGNRECDGCGDCRPKETGVTITATIKLEFITYGQIETLMRSGKWFQALSKSEEMVEGLLNCEYPDAITIESIKADYNE